MAAPRRRFEGEPGEYGGPTIEPPRALYQEGQAGDQAYARDLVLMRHRAALEALQQGDEMAAREQAAAGARTKTGVRDPGIDPSMARPMPQQAAPIGPGGRFGDTMIHAESYQYPRPEGTAPLQETPGFVEHEARLWDQGLRSSVPVEDEPDPNESFADAFKRRRPDQGRMI